MKIRRGAARLDTPDEAHESVQEAEVEDREFVSPQHSGRLLGEILTEHGAATDEQISAALERQRSLDGRLGEMLVEQGVVDERTVTAAVAEQYDLKVVDLRRFTPEDDAIEQLTGDTARNLRVLPLRVTEHGLIIALDDVPSAEVLATLIAHLGRNFGILLAPPSELTRSLESSYRALDHVSRFLGGFEGVQDTRGTTVAVSDDVADDDAPVVRVISLLLTQAVTDRASDVHIEPQGNSLRVRFRVDGALHEVLTLPPRIAQSLVSRIKIMADMNIVERRRAQDGQFEFSAEGRTLDVRVATVPMFWGEKVVLRLLDRKRSVFELPDLGMPAETSAEFSKIIRSPFGMVICAGPTGSGKTTTLYAALNEINDDELNVTTIEDPIEYVFPSINQIQINEAADMTFATGLKAILRQDPDIILVGEMRDVETTRIAVQSALTGHFVLSSLHATDAVAALQRFLDMGIESFLIASSVIAVVGQRLVRRVCRHCRIPYEPSAEEVAFYYESGGREKEQFWRGEGCNFCGQTGYADRVGVFELLRVNDAVKELILQNAPHEKILAVAVSQGMRTMSEEAIHLVENDVTTIGEILRRIYVT
jgi:type IV pilus assembly protein PilB